MNYQTLARFTQDLNRLLEEHRGNPHGATIFLIDKSPLFFILNFAGDIMYLLFCIYLMFHDTTWTPGVLLLAIATLESYALYGRIDGTFFIAKDGYAYPRLWWRYFCCGSTIFILTQLLQNSGGLLSLLE